MSEWFLFCRTRKKWCSHSCVIGVQISILTMVHWYLILETYLQRYMQWFVINSSLFDLQIPDDVCIILITYIILFSTDFCLLSDRSLVERTQASWWELLEKYLCSYCLKTGPLYVTKCYHRPAATHFNSGPLLTMQLKAAPKTNATKCNSHNWQNLHHTTTQQCNSSNSR